MRGAMISVCLEGPYLLEEEGFWGINWRWGGVSQGRRNYPERLVESRGMGIYSSICVGRHSFLADLYGETKRYTLEYSIFQRRISSTES